MFRVLRTSFMGIKDKIFELKVFMVDGLQVSLLLGMSLITYYKGQLDAGISSWCDIKN